MVQFVESNFRVKTAYFSTDGKVSNENLKAKEQVWPSSKYDHQVIESCTHDQPILVPLVKNLFRHLLVEGSYILDLLYDR